jgi:hypothetical protein
MKRTSLPLPSSITALHESGSAGETMSDSFTRREAIGGAALGAGAATLGGIATQIA